MKNRIAFTFMKIAVARKPLILLSILFLSISRTACKLVVFIVSTDSLMIPWLSLLMIIESLFKKSTYMTIALDISKTVDKVYHWKIWLKYPVLLCGKIVVIVQSSKS